MSFLEKLQTGKVSQHRVWDGKLPSVQKLCPMTTTPDLSLLCVFFLLLLLETRKLSIFAISQSTRGTYVTSHIPSPISL